MVHHASIRSFDGIFLEDGYEDFIIAKSKSALCIRALLGRSGHGRVGQMITPDEFVPR